MSAKKAKAKKPVKAKRAPATKKAASRKNPSGRPPIGGSAGSRVLGFKVPLPDFGKAKKKAKTFANGRMATWARFAIVNFEPTATQKKALRDLVGGADDEA